MTDQPPIINPTPDNPDWATHAQQPANKASLCGLADADPDTMTGPPYHPTHRIPTRRHHLAPNNYQPRRPTQRHRQQPRHPPMERPTTVLTPYDAAR